MKKAKPKKITVKKAPAAKKASTAKTPVISDTLEKSLSSVDTQALIDVHAMTKELIKTLYTIDKSLTLVTQLLTVLDSHNINLSRVNTRQVSSLLSKINPNKLEQSLEIFKKPEVLELINTLSNATSVATSNTSSKEKS